MPAGRDNSAEITVSPAMSRPVIVPTIMVAIAVVGLAGAFTTHRSDGRARKLRDQAARDDSIRRQVTARHDSELTEKHAASAPACPREPQDVSAWGAATQESFPVVVPVVPDFTTELDQRGDVGRLSFRGDDDESYTVSYGLHATSVADWPQYELVAECADLADVMPGTIQTAREKQGGSFTKVVLASYRLPDGNFISFHGTTRDVNRQALLITAAHHMRLKR
jgi:hypothetical protein